MLDVIGQHSWREVPIFDTHFVPIVFNLFKHIRAASVFFSCFGVLSKSRLPFTESAGGNVSGLCRLPGGDIMYRLLL